MKRSLFILLILSCMFSCGKVSHDANLEKMGRAVKKYIKSNDAEKNLRTAVELLEPLSYEEIPEDKRIEKEDAYVCKVHLIAKSAYEGSARIYNINDTMTCYFNDKIQFLRWEKEGN